MTQVTKFIVGLLFIFTAGFSAPAEREFYCIRIYHVSNSEQEAGVEAYLKNAYLPAMHRAGIKKVGVFKPVETDTLAFHKKIYVLIPLSKLDDLASAEAKLQKDEKHTSAAGAYWSAPYDHVPYDRIETILTHAFSDMPAFQVPSLKGPVGERIYELRSYEGPTEKIFANKVHMFNQGGEIILFKKLGFNAVFYSEVVAGSKMPNLMYMTSFDNRASRDAHWKTFVDDPDWKRMSTAPEYQHNVSKIEIYLLHPTEYSEI